MGNRNLSLKPPICLLRDKPSEDIFPHQAYGRGGRKPDLRLKSVRFRVFAFFLVRAAFRQGKGRAAALLQLGLLTRRLIAGLAVRVLRRLLCLILGLLGLLRRHDAEVMLRMLKIILGHHPVAARIGVAGELEIFLINMAGRTADLDFRTRGIERPVGVETTTAAMAAAIVMAATAIAVLRPAAASA